MIEIMCHPMYNTKGEIIDKVKAKEPDECEKLIDLLKQLPASTQVAADFDFEDIL